MFSKNILIKKFENVEHSFHKKIATTVDIIYFQKIFGTVSFSFMQCLFEPKQMKFQKSVLNSLYSPNSTPRHYLYFTHSLMTMQLMNNLGNYI